MRETLADCLQGQEVSAEGLTPKTAENTLRFLIAEGWPITDEMIGSFHFDAWMGPIDFDGVIEQRDQMFESQKERAEKDTIELAL